MRVRLSDDCQVSAGTVGLAALAARARPGEVIMENRKSASLVVGALVIALLAGACSSPWGGDAPEFGRVPSDAKLGDGSTDLEAVPDFVEALGRDGEPVGYVPREYLFHTEEDVRAAGASEIPVYDKDLNPIGFMTDNKGFVPLHEDDG